MNFFKVKSACLFCFKIKPEKKDDQQLELKTSPKKIPDSTVDLLGLGE